MSLSRIKTWNRNEILLSTDLNAEFNTILSNGSSLVFPLSNDLDVGSKLLINTGLQTPSQLHDAILTMDKFSNSLPVAIASIGSTKTTLLIGSAITVGADATIPDNIMLWFIGPGKLFVNATYTLTINGLLNRRRFFEIAEAESSKAQTTDIPFSVIMLDVDDFKQFNDRHGHKVGDEVLVLTALTCKTSLRADDIFGRLGGEEFAVLLPETDRTAAAEVAERLREAIAHAKVPLEGGLPVQFTVSIVVASMSSIDDNMDVLLHIADTALYDAKKAGCNRVCIAFK